MELVPGVEFLKTDANSGSNGICLEEFAPFGVIGIITPVTHSVPTLTANIINMVASGNSIVANAHPSGVIVLTPQGKISRYFLGVNFDAREIDQAITAARNEANGSIVQRLALICYHYNPITGKYGALIMSILRLGGIATVLAIGLSIFLLARKGSHPQT